MIGTLIIFGLCYLGLGACGIVLLVDDIKEYKWRKRMKDRRNKNDYKMS